MSDSPLKVEVAVPGEALDEAAAELMAKAFGAPATELGSLTGDLVGILGDQVRAWRHLNRVRIAKAVRARLESQNIAPEDIRALPMREVSGTLQSISEVDQPTIASLWAGLIAAAVNPESDVSIDRSLKSTIDMISERDAIIFSAMTNAKIIENGIKQYLKENFPTAQEYAAMGSEKAAKVSNDNNTKAQNRFRPIFSWINEQIEIAEGYGAISEGVSNLHRLGLIEYGPVEYIDEDLIARRVRGRMDSRADPIGLIKQVVNEIDLPSQRRKHWERYAIQKGKDRLPIFNIRATKFGRKLAEACMIYPPDEYDSLFL